MLSVQSLAITLKLIMSQSVMHRENVHAVPGDTMLGRLLFGTLHRFEEQSVLLRCCCQLLILPFYTLC